MKTIPIVEIRVETTSGPVVTHAKLADLKVYDNKAIKQYAKEAAKRVGGLVVYFDLDFLRVKPDSAHQLTKNYKTNSFRIA